MDFRHFFREVVSCTNIAIIFLGVAQVSYTIYSLGIISCLLIFGSLWFAVNYFKVERAPLQNSKCVFNSELSDLDSDNQPTSTSDGDDNNGLLVNGVGLLRSLDKTGTSEEDFRQGAGGITIVGHRGAGLDAPENSLSAFKLCKRRGCDFVEFDVALTKDNVPIVFHDDDFLRMAGLNAQVTDLTYKEIKQIDLSLNHPLKDKFVGERVPTFAEAIDLLLQLKMRFFIDLKDTNPTIVNAVCEAFVNNPQMYKLAVVSSFYPKVIYDIRRRDPNIIGCMAWRPNFFQYKSWSVDGQTLEPRFDFFLQHWLAFVLDHIHDWVLPHFLWWFLGLSAILLNKDSVSRHDLDGWRRKGIRVFVWTVNNPSEKLYFSENAKVDYLTDTLHGNVLRSPPRPSVM